MLLIILKWRPFMNENIQKKCVLQSLALGGNESNLAPQAAMSNSAAVPPVLVSILYNKNRAILLQNWGWNNYRYFSEIQQWDTWVHVWWWQPPSNSVYRLHGDDFVDIEMRFQNYKDFRVNSMTSCLLWKLHLHTRTERRRGCTHHHWQALTDGTVS